MVQKEALDLLKLGHNIFLTGAAGSGKTYVLNQYIEYLRKHKIPVGVTASTGIAATHLNGMTIHSWCGIGIKDVLSDKDITEILGKSYLWERLLTAKVLIIDEISMLHAHRLDMVDKVCRAFKASAEPFGGLQVVMCGDFFQLPPVSNGDESDNFAYNSNVWNEMDLKVCYLHEQYRQSDSAFLQVLEDIRSSKVNNTTLQCLIGRYNKEVEGFNPPTRLYTHNVDVDAINNMQLSKIDEKPHEYEMTSSGIRELVDFLKKNCLAPEHLEVKISAVVMFVKNNFNKGYVNGTLGKVIGFDKNDYPIVKTLNGKEIIVAPTSWKIENETGSVMAEISQIPLRLAWAITVHKSQGMSLDAAEIDLSKSFVPGMGYVALSRVRTLKGMKLVGLNELALQVNKDVVIIDDTFIDLSRKANEFLLEIGKEKKKLQKEFVKVKNVI